jgi:nuclear pore complex protein Nup133
VAKIFDELPALIEVMLSTALEYGRWGQAQSDPQTKERAASFGKLYSEARYTLTTGLAGMEKWDEAARIAERHESLDALAVILLDHIWFLEAARDEVGVSPVQAQTIKTTRSAKIAKLEDCFAKYGEAFAYPVYAHLLESHGVDGVLGFELDRHGYKTKFLRSRPELARISWIHDVQQEKNVHHAAETLLDLALNKEQQVWNKKVELSLGKLAMLAEQSSSSSQDFRVNADEARKEEKLKQVDKELVAIKIQQCVYDVVSRCTYAAVDDKAAFEFVMDTHGKEIPNRQKALHHIFADGVKRLLNHEVLDAMTLIDLLTLMLFDESSRELIYNPFWLALKVSDSV